MRLGSTFSVHTDQEGVCLSQNHVHHANPLIAQSSKKVIYRSNTMLGPKSSCPEKFVYNLRRHPSATGEKHDVAGLQPKSTYQKMFVYVMIDRWTQKLHDSGLDPTTSAHHKECWFTSFSTESHLCPEPWFNHWAFGTQS